MTEKAIIMFVVRNGDTLEGRYYAWSDEAKDWFLSEDRSDAQVMDMANAEEAKLLMLKNKDNEFPIVIPVANEEE